MHLFLSVTRCTCALSGKKNIKFEKKNCKQNAA